MRVTVQGCAGFAQTLHMFKPNEFGRCAGLCRVCMVPRTHTRAHIFSIFLARTEFIYLSLFQLETLHNPAHPAHHEQVYKNKRFFDVHGLCLTLPNPARWMK